MPSWIGITVKEVSLHNMVIHDKVSSQSCLNGLSYIVVGFYRFTIYSCIYKATYCLSSVIVVGLISLHVVSVGVATCSLNLISYLRLTFYFHISS